MVGWISRGYQAAKMETMLSGCAALLCGRYSGLGCQNRESSRLSKHGFSWMGVWVPADLGRQISKTMLIRHEALSIPFGCASAKPQNPLWMPQGIRFLNETKLRKSAADNLRWSCTCSKHGLSLADALAPGDLERWIRKTMLSGCAALLCGRYSGLGCQNRESSRLDKHGLRSRSLSALGVLR